MQAAFVKSYLSILLLSSICFISVFSAIWIRIDPDSAEAVKARDRIAKELNRRVVATEFAFKRLDVSEDYHNYSSAETFFSFFLKFKY
jgi:hypothetical protein